MNDVIVVGRLLRRLDEPMRTQFEINDNTHTYYVLFYHKGENQVPTALRNFHYEQFTYVKIYGNIRVFKDEKAIVGSHIKRIEKFDEISNHFLSVFVSNCIRKKGILKPKDSSLPQESHVINNPTKDLEAHIQVHRAAPEPSRPRPPTMLLLSDDDLKKKVIDAMQEYLRYKQFVSKEDILKNIQETNPEVDSRILDIALTRLMHDGVIMSAHDNNHFFFV